MCESCLARFELLCCLLQQLGVLWRRLSRHLRSELLHIFTVAQRLVDLAPIALLLRKRQHHRSQGSACKRTPHHLGEAHRSVGAPGPLRTTPLQSLCRLSALQVLLGPPPGVFFVHFLHANAHMVQAQVGHDGLCTAQRLLVVDALVVRTVGTLASLGAHQIEKVEVCGGHAVRRQIQLGERQHCETLTAAGGIVHQRDVGCAALHGRSECHHVLWNCDWQDDRTLQTPIIIDVALLLVVQQVLRHLKVQLHHAAAQVELCKPLLLACLEQLQSMQACTEEHAMLGLQRCDLDPRHAARRPKHGVCLAASRLPESHEVDVIAIDKLVEQLWHHRVKHMLLTRLRWQNPRRILEMSRVLWAAPQRDHSCFRIPSFDVLFDTFQLPCRSSMHSLWLETHRDLDLPRQEVRRARDTTSTTHHDPSGLLRPSSHTQSVLWRSHFHLQEEKRGKTGTGRPIHSIPMLG
mmetsp:Transcript_31821/g.74416  ORF Transcript_31821/g.74416 Transcript_31821/m.74416 type:complete len:463 (-) Transcript_31821:99-1487(-)